jgi:hypothetical protein
LCGFITTDGLALAFALALPIAAGEALLSQAFTRSV